MNGPNQPVDYSVTIRFIVDTIYWRMDIDIDAYVECYYCY